MAELSPDEHEIAELIIRAANLEGLTPDDIDPEAPLMGTGLGLDSIDALEIAIAVSTRYNVQLRAEEADRERIFASLRSFTRHLRARAAGRRDASHQPAP